MAHDFEVRSSELLLDAPIIAVRRDEVVMPGGTTAYREVVEHFGAVAIVAGEDELTGAKRELQEEAGLAAEDWSVLADIITSPGFCEEAVRVFLSRGLSAVPRMDAEGDEEADMDFAWVPLDEAVDRVISGDIVNSIAATGILAAYVVYRGGRKTRSVDEPFELRPTAMAARRPGPDLKKL